LRIFRSFFFKFAVSLLAFFSQPISYAQQVEFPRNFRELGFGFEQIGYPVPVEIVLIDYEALRRDFPELKIFSDQIIKTWIESQIGFVTETQLNLNGLLTTQFEIPAPSKKLIVQPVGYHRSGVVSFNCLGKSVGLFDLKGTGLSPLRYLQLKGVLKIIEALESGESLTAEKKEELKKVISLKKRDVEMGIRQIDVLLHSSDSEKKELIRKLQLGLAKSTDQKAALDKALAYLDKGDEVARQESLQSFRGNDYQNGTISLDRAVKEMITQKVARKILTEHNLKYGTSFGTVDTYFVAKLPFRVWTPNGKLVPAAILGRQPSFRRDTYLTRPLPPNVGAGIGDPQLTGLGDLIDFETFETNDPRASGTLLWQGDPAYQEIDRITSRALERFERGQKNIFEKVRKKILKPFRSSRVKTGEAPKEKSQFVSQDLIKKWIQFIREDLTQKDPDMFEFFKLARELGKSSNTRVMLATLLEMGASFWPAPVTQFTEKWIHSPAFKGENIDVILGILYALKTQHRDDLALKILEASNTKTSDAAKIFYSVYKMNLKDRANSSIEDRASGQIPTDLGQYAADLLLIATDLINNPIIEERWLQLKYNLLSADLSQKTSLAVYEWPLKVLLRSEKLTPEQVEEYVYPVVRRLSPEAQSRVLNRCGSLVSALRK
jgi:hypothetical protein